MCEQYPNTSQNETCWVELPGLFDASEIESVDDLEVRAFPLVIRDGKIFYGVYVRERNIPETVSLKQAV